MVLPADELAARLERQAARIRAITGREPWAGDIIVIHDGHHADPRADRRHAAETMRRLAPQLRSRAFDFAPLC